MTWDDFSMDAHADEWCNEVIAWCRPCNRRSGYRSWGAHGCNPQTAKDYAFKQGDGMPLVPEQEAGAHAMKHVSVQNGDECWWSTNDEKTRAWNGRDNNMGAWRVSCRGVAILYPSIQGYHVQNLRPQHQRNQESPRQLPANRAKYVLMSVPVVRHMLSKHPVMLRTGRDPGTEGEQSDPPWSFWASSLQLASL